jgi:hypothetical protein
VLLNTLMNLMVKNAFELFFNFMQNHDKLFCRSVFLLLNEQKEFDIPTNQVGRHLNETTAELVLYKNKTAEVFLPRLHKFH